MEKMTRNPETVVHPTALVDHAAALGEGVVVGPYCVVGPEVSIGAGTVLESAVVLTGKVTIGCNNLIGHHAIIGTPPQLLKDLGAQVGVVIGDNNIIRESVSINSGTEQGGGPTRIGNDCFLMIAAHVAHDCILCDHVEIMNSALLAGHVKVKKGAIVSGGNGVHHFVTIGTLAFSGGLSKLVQDVPPFMLVDGNPARVRGVNVVGLRRAGFDETRINALKQAHRTLYRSKLSRTKALEMLESRRMTPDVEYLVRFCRAAAGGKQGRARENLRNA